MSVTPGGARGRRSQSERASLVEAGGRGALHALERPGQFGLPTAAKVPDRLFEAEEPVLHLMGCWGAPSGVGVTWTPSLQARFAGLLGQTCGFHLGHVPTVAQIM